MLATQMLYQPNAAPSSERGASADRYSVLIARTSREVEEAQRLRYQVFFEEMGARASDHNAAQQLDEDEFDQDCEHLIVRDNESNMLVGCYRIMRPRTARRRGGFYADREFDLSRLANLRDNTAEVGRACIHPEFRNGATIMLLWSGLANFMRENRYEHVIGCASIPLAEGHANAQAVYEAACATSLAPQEYRVFPRLAYPLDATPRPNGLASTDRPNMPALVKGYIRLGAWICGAPAWDIDFNTADLFVLLPMQRMNRAYAKHFFAR
jgi:putative hemolysin